MPGTLEGETIIYFGPDPWTGLWRNRHQLMSRFARRNNVWYVEPPPTLRHLLSRGKRGGGFTLRSRLASRDPSGVRVFHSPWWLPITGRPPLKTASIRLYLAILRLTAGAFRRKPILWLSRPGMIDYLDGFPGSLTIYHVVDEYGGYGFQSAVQREALAAREADLLRRVDVALVVTETLLHSKAPYNPNTYHVPNAVDFEAYAGSGIPAPQDIAQIPRPIIGYTGLIAARLDLDLLHAAARARPEWSWVFVGHVRDDACRAQIERLRALPNVHFLGQKPAHETPAYVRCFDIGIIPYTINLRARHASPLKLYEYAAASKPIVATDFTAARDFQGHVEIIHDVDGFIAACERCLSAGADSASVRGNRALAADNTWAQRIEQISGIIHAHRGRISTNSRARRVG